MYRYQQFSFSSWNFLHIFSNRSLSVFEASQAIIAKRPITKSPVQSNVAESDLMVERTKENVSKMASDATYYLNSICVKKVTFT